MLDNNKNFWTFLLLTFVTCGIYGIIFWLRFIDDVNTVTQDDGDPLPNYWLILLLGFVTCGIYSYYMYYKLGDKLYNCGQRRGVMITENATTILIWTLVGLITGGLGIYVAMFFCIENYNKLATHYNQMVSSGMGASDMGSNVNSGWSAPVQDNQNGYWDNNNQNNG